MKARVVVGLIAAFSLIIFFSAQANAAYKFYTCTVEHAGYNVSTGDVQIKLKPNGKSTAKLFYVSDTNGDAVQNRFLAVAIAAISSGCQVAASIDWESPGEIQMIRLVAP
ncbi:MAG: hypothetical protein JRJ12_14790 [Deltaproteobacteria bacterium]|nr:hypothetical protein [Deltaproteobacteria bacterium]MBW2072787.1 hypothetical protein [Deltaproteobacteria bacterium]